MRRGTAAAQVSRGLSGIDPIALQRGRAPANSQSVAAARSPARASSIMLSWLPSRLTVSTPWIGDPATRRAITPAVSGPRST